MTAAAKAALRRELRSRRAALDDATRRAASDSITGHVLALAAWERARTVTLYLSLPEEVNTARLLDAALAQGKRLGVPRLGADGAMEIVHVEDLDHLVAAPGQLAIRQPAPGVGCVLAPAEIDLNLIPCVGVDCAGQRLGFGGGCYDRLLAQTRPDAVNLGLVFACQVIDALPREPHDEALDGWVTEAGAVSVRPCS